MAILKIVTGADNKILRTKSALVKKIDKKAKKLISDMVETMLDCDGLGLAAPQVGVNERIFVARLNFQTKNETIVSMINARLSKVSEEKEDGEEGCLSLPKKFGIVRRAASLAVKYTDRRGKLNALNLTGLNARIMQHEMDHLDGILIVDKMEREIDPEDLEERRGI